MKSMYWLKALVCVLVILPGLLFVLGSTGLLMYIYWPRAYDEVSLPVSLESAEHIVVLAHGLKDTRETWSDPLKKILEDADRSVQIISLNWSPYADSSFRCSVDGRRIGNRIGQRLAASKKLRSVHLAGHSCGSFVVLGICETIKDRRAEVAVQTTFLDPVTVYGGLSWEYGLDHFGRCGDFSDAYIDTGDNVPGSNQLLPHTHTFDVTEVRKATGFTGSPHVWPTVYYQALFRSGKAPDLRKDKAVGLRYPQGVLERVQR